jgi:hypothetical protein
MILFMLNFAHTLLQRLAVQKSTVYEIAPSLRFN